MINLPFSLQNGRPVSRSVAMTFFIVILVLEFPAKKHYANALLD